jgi:hypothetical protein
MKIDYLKIAACGCLILACFNNLHASEDEQSPITYGHYRKINSKILNEARTILVSLPSNYKNTDKRYPVLYKLDGEKEIFLQTTMEVWYLSVMAERIPEHIVIAIENTDRNRDMAIERGADKFNRFIKEELFEFVENNYRTSDFRILCGQSSSSMFACYSFITQPEMFNAYIFSSFGFSNKGIELYKKDFLPNFKPVGTSKRYLFITNALKDPYDPDGVRTQNGLKFIDELKKIGSDSVIIKYKTYDDEGHVPFPSVYDGLKWLYEIRT